MTRWPWWNSFWDYYNEWFVYACKVSDTCLYLTYVYMYIYIYGYCICVIVSKSCEVRCTFVGDSRGAFRVARGLRFKDFVCGWMIISKKKKKYDYECGGESAIFLKTNLFDIWWQLSGKLFLKVYTKKYKALRFVCDVRSMVERGLGTNIFQKVDNSTNEWMDEIFEFITLDVYYFW